MVAMRIMSQVLSPGIAAILLAACASSSTAQNTSARAATIRTPTPALLADWKAATAGANATLADASKIAEEQRPRVKRDLPDYFTPLAGMTCPERLSLPEKERVVWEDSNLMALVDFGDRGTKLLVIPKVEANFPIDLADNQLAYLSRVAAATCDALLVAAGRPSADEGSCTISITPPTGIGMRQLHVHVKALTGIPAPVDDAYLRRTGTHLRSLVGGKGC